jgi:amidase
MTAPTAINPFARAKDMLAALEAREISSRELTELHIERIERLNPALNAICIPTFERGRAMAAEADERRERGERTPLLGLPHTTKESNEVAGLPQTAGIPELAGRHAESDGPVPSKIFEAGAPLLGKTNIPVALADWQANSPNYGRTNNPWDLGRSPGGSTGGGSAALAAGLTPLEFGSDIGGSVRTPSAFCGVYGHRPSDSLWPRHGAFPMSSHPNASAVLAVQGPMARSAHDLEIALDVVACADPGEDVAWRLELPAARSETLAGLRVAVLPAIPWVPVSGEMRSKLDELASWLSQQGAKVAEASPAFDWREHYLDYNKGLMSRTTGAQPLEMRQGIAGHLRASGDDEKIAIADGMLLSATEFYALMDKRESYRRAFREFFKDWDVLLTPMALSEAFEHVEKPFDERTLDIDGQQVSYRLQVFYPSVATLAGQPATAFPGGLTKTGLPRGLQAVGPYLEDRTPLRFAQLVEDQRGGFVPPQGYA